MGIAPARATRDIEQILRAASVEGWQNVYFLGPFATRINFAAQQSRALNLVYALLAKKRVLPDHRIAVIGGGMAGLTLSTALHLLGFEVHLIEAKPIVFARQINAKHRQLHPTVNQWPTEKNLVPTTAFPFFNWMTDTCNEVLTKVTNEWRMLAGDAMEAAQRLHMKTKVTGRFPAGDRISLVTDPPFKNSVFDIVIYATGFEDERLLSEHYPGTYWNDDLAESERDNDPKGDARFVISGTGDGGLIDAIRLSYRGEAAGILALQVATALASSAKGRAIGDALGLAEQQYAKSARKPVDRAALWTAYAEAADALPEDIARVMEKDRVTEPAPAVDLVGEDETLVERAAAPIHKLIVTYTERAGSVRYTRGIVKIDQATRELSIVPLPQGATAKDAPTVLITRHGAPNSLVEILGEESAELAHIKAAQQNLADDFADPIGEVIASLKFEFPAGFRTMMPATAQYRYEIRKRLFGLVRIWPYFESFDVSPDGFYIDSSDLAAWYPSQLFGMPVERRPAYGPSDGR